MSVIVTSAPSPPGRGLGRGFFRPAGGRSPPAFGYHQRMGVVGWTGAALDAALRDPACFETFSVLSGAPLLLVDLTQAPDALSPTALARLATLPVVTVGIGPASGTLPLAQCLDLLLAQESELDELSRALARRPLASLALVQLLRSNAASSIEAGLLSESRVYSLLQSGPEFKAWLRARPRPRRSRPPACGPALRVEREAARLLLCFNRPERRNAFGVELRDALCEALALVLRDDTLREVELRGAGAAFSSGGDLDEFGTLPDPATAHAIRSTRNAARLLASCADRVHARVHGACIGAGAELPAFCARVSAREDAFFALPELSMGLVPGAGGTVSLPRRIGRHRTAWMALTGARVDAPTALAWGLVDKIERA